MECDDPVTMAVVGIAGASLSAYGTYKQAQAEGSALDANSQIIANNATIARNDALVKEAEADAEIVKARRVAERQTAETRAQIAKAGVQVEGSPLLALTEQMAVQEVDISNILRQQEAQSANLRAESAQYDIQSSILKTQAKTARRIGTISAIGQFGLGVAKAGMSGGGSLLSSGGKSKLMKSGSLGLGGTKSGGFLNG